MPAVEVSTRARRAGLGLAIVVLVCAGCTGEGSSPPDVRGSAPASASAGPTDVSSSVGPGTTPAVTDTPTQPASPTATPHPVSLPALMRQTYDGSALTVGRRLDATSAYTRYHVTYTSAGLTVSGVMNVPVGSGPFPVLVLAHGYIDPDVYTNGRGLRREQDYLARQGYVVLHTDYRNHAQSDDDPDNELRLRLGYTEDVVNAVLAVRSSTLPYLDGDRIGLLGRSMGGGVVLNTLVVQPGLVDAAVIYASVSSDAADNFDRWTRSDTELADRIVSAYGAPETAKAFWQGVSPRTYVDQVTEPILMHHGEADETCPIAWAYDTDAALRAAGKDVTLVTYPGEGHAFEAGWQRSIERSAAFFDQHLTS